MSARQVIERACVGCGNTIRGARLAHRKFCGDRCRIEHWRLRHNRRHPVFPTAARLSTGVVGAVSELIVSADLLGRGYEVFRSVSQSCSCDLAALKNGTFLRIEVRTGSVNKQGVMTCSLSKNDIGRSDVLAVVDLSSNRIEYRPDLPQEVTP